MTAGLHVQSWAGSGQREEQTELSGGGKSRHGLALLEEFCLPGLRHPPGRRLARQVKDLDCQAEELGPEST